MKHVLAIVGAVALLAWTGLGLVAWGSVAQRVTVRLSEDEAGSEESARVLELGEELGALREDVRALAGALGESLQSLQDGLAARQDEHASALERRIETLREERGSSAPFPSAHELSELLAEIRAQRGLPEASTPPATETEDVARAVPGPQTPPVPPAAPQRASFLAFKLPSDDFRFDERRAWAVLPSLSRVGFDAKTTLHDFSAVTSSIEGELEVDLARPADEPHLRLRVEAAGLDSGEGARDEEMRERLAVGEHPLLEFELTRFEPEALDLEAQRGSGRAHGRMTLRGVTREVAMSVRYSIDDARRLCVEGEMPLDLTHFDVPVPDKLGLITMQEEVAVWISLRLRAAPRTRG